MQHTLTRSLFVILALASIARAADDDKHVVLFDGKSVDGWHQAGPGGFDFKDGTLVSKGGMGLYWFDKEFADFKLELDWKVNRQGANSGVFVRFPDPGNDPWVAVKQGHEIQICDEEKGNQTGAIYNFKNSEKLLSKPAGEWNHYIIRVVGKHYTVVLNGRGVNEFDSPDRPLTGHIGLQNHDPTSTVTFKDITVTALTSPLVLTPTDPTTKKTEPGLVGEYFKDVKTLAIPTSQPFLVRVDPTMKFRRISGQFDGSKLSNDFAARWTGYLKVTQPGQYRLFLRADDHAVLYLNDKLALDNSKIEPGQENGVEIQLTAGLYPLKLCYQKGAGGAQCVLSWRAPDAVNSVALPETAFVHDAGAQAAIAWNQKAWDDAVWSRRAWALEHGEKYDKMDYGPYLAATVHISEKNMTNKGLAIKVGKDDAGTVLFDTELLRYSGGWVDGFLDNHGVAFDGQHGVNLGPDGRVIFETPAEPGARQGTATTRPYVDPRSPPFGPLPAQEWGHYKGLYLDGNRVILDYSVGDCDVLDSPGAEIVDGKIVFVRSLRLGATKQPITLMIANLGVGLDSTQIGHSGKVKLTDESGRRYATFPASNSAEAYRITIDRVGDNISPEAITRILNTKEDIRAMTNGGKPRWPKIVETKGEVAKNDKPYVVDTLTAPETNPYNSWLRFGALDFFSDGRAALTTWSGDVWVVSGIDDKLDHLKWKRYATGLFQPLGLRIVDDQVYVLGRDQITRLHDLNGDGEADFYENFNNDCQVTSSFHEFSFDLQTDSQGNFYYAKAGPVRPGGRGWETISDNNGCILKVSKDGSQFSVYGVGLRAPNGMSVGPHDEITIADNEGTWTPACRLSLVHPGMFLGVPDLAHRTPAPTDYERPICWLPHGDVDNSSGGQVWVTPSTWGPFAGRMLHLSYGTCSLFLVSYEMVDGQVQGGVVRFPLEFATGIMRARFHPVDHQLYLTGLRGWQTTAAKDCALQRVRYTGKPVKMPTDFHITPDGVTVNFTAPLDSKSAADMNNYSIEQWNYLWSSAYGSAEYSVEDPKAKSHDPVEIKKITLSPDKKSIHLTFDEPPKVVMQMKIQMKLKSEDGAPMEYTIYNTINKVPGARANPTANAPATQASNN